MRIIFLAGVIFLHALCQAQSKKTVESKIDKVTVFLQGAQVERSAKANLPAGKSEIIFAGISPAIDKQSIQVKAGDNVTVLSVIHQQNFMQEQQKQEEINTLEEQKEAQLEKMSFQKNNIEIYKQEEIMLTKNQQIGGANTGVKAADLKDAVDFQRNRLTELYAKQTEATRALKKLETELSKMNKQLAELHQQADISTSEIHVTVNTKEITNADFAISYLVKQSGWFPTYDIRVKDISSPINLQYKANVFQSSGEDWKEVKLFLSTGNPNENETKPAINPWYLKYVYGPRIMTNTIQGMNAENIMTGRIVNEKDEPVPYASVFIKGTRTGVAADANGFFMIQAPAGNNTLSVTAVGMQAEEIPVQAGRVDVTLKRVNESLSEVVVVGYGAREAIDDSNLAMYRKSKELGYSTSKIEADNITRGVGLLTNISYQPTTTVYEIKDPYTILNDGKTYMVDIDGYQVNAQYEYYTAPKIDPSVFLTAKISDWQELNLLPGEANLFFEGTFLGKSLLDLANAGDTLNLSLGKDKGIMVKRTLLKDFSSRKFLGSNKTDTREYEIAIRNNKQQPINIVVEDQFPVSTQKEIEVQEKKYDGARLDDDTQKITWQFSVESKKDNKVNFKYEVKYPKEKVLQLD